MEFGDGLSSLLLVGYLGYIYDRFIVINIDINFFSHHKHNIYYLVAANKYFSVRCLSIIDTEIR